MIKDIWLSQDGRKNIFSICIRCHGSEEATCIPQLVVDKSTLPPLGSRMNMDDAIRDGVEEDHFIISNFHTNDLILLRDKINTALRDRL